MDIQQSLQALGMTDYEARAYLALVDGGELNGYELAKASGIPRANVYAVADKLLQRGAAQRLEVDGGQRYTAVPPARLLRAIATRQQQALNAAREQLDQRASRQPPRAVFTLRGDEVLNRAQRLIEASETSLLVAIQPGEAKQLAAALQHARERGVVITTLCLEACAHECGGCQGDLYRYALTPDHGSRWLVLVSDEHAALLGQLGPTTVEGVVTEQHLVVQLASAYIRQSVALATLGTEMAGRFEGLLSQQAQQVLSRLYPGGGFPAFIQSLTGGASGGALSDRPTSDEVKS